MKLLRVRNLIFLALVYLLLVSLLYHYLWQARALDRLFDVPGQSNGHRFPSANGRGDLIIYDDDADSDADLEQGGGRVEFNFRRNPAPRGVVVYNGYGKAKSPNKTNQENTQSRHSHHFNTSETPSSSNASYKQPTHLKQIYPVTERAEITRTNVSHGNVSLAPPTPCLHAFYYAWYGNIDTDNRYMHWNHRYLPHWVESVTKKYPQGRHIPPDDIGASFYPQLGCYSSKDPAVIAAHMRQLRQARIGVIAVSWYPAGLSDDEGPPPDPVIPVLLDSALEYGIKVTLHIEPYKGRTPQSVRKDLQYIHTHYSNHPSLYKLERKTLSGDVRQLPLIYIYDSYLSTASEWAKVLKPGGEVSIRGKEYDVIAIGLLVERSHMHSLLEGGFDGFYTYFAANDFSFGSTFKNWGVLAKFAHQNNLLFVPSFGPGYDDLQVRPWNGKTSRQRRNGDYYREGFAAALKNSVGSLVSITSFNEWLEGTQIEPAVPRKRQGYTYLDYSPQGPGHYLQLTRELSWQLDCGIT